jgi:HPt (histidine-containing phosphotransfer) domain-containing protein
MDGDDPSDLDWIKDMISTLFKNMSDRMDNLVDFSLNHKHDKLKAELHQIKGVAANFGLKDLYDLVLDAETKVKNGIFSEATILIPKVLDTWDATKLELESQYPELK